MASETVTQATHAGLAALPGVMTYDEFLKWDGENQHVEWVEGKIVFMSPISLEHADVGVFLLRILAAYAEVRDLGKVLHDPFQMKTGPELPGRAPDILFVKKEHLGRLQRLYLDGPGDLVVEIISPGSRTVDRGEKFYEYEQGGVPEFWLVDPQRKQVEFYQRGEDGIFRLVQPGGDGIYRSTSLPGLWLKVGWLWESPLPSTVSVLKEWKLI